MPAGDLIGKEGWGLKIALSTLNTGRLALPLHRRGVVGSQPGLYFVGLFFLSGFTSSLLGGVGRDAAHVAAQIAARAPARRPTTHDLAGIPTP